MAALFFRQAVGRLVRWNARLRRQAAYMFIPDDIRLRTFAASIAEQRRHTLQKETRDDEPGRGEDGPPRAAIQESARAARYAALLKWCAETGATMLLTAHHADDQAETLLMRLGRGAGLAGLAGIRPVRESGCRIVRPLLGWRADELANLCRKAGLIPIDDPSNADPRHERSRVRKLLRASDALDAVKLAQSADHLFEAEEAMRWTTAEVVRSRAEIGANRISFDAEGLPREIKRRALALLL